MHRVSQPTSESPSHATKHRLTPEYENSANDGPKESEHSCTANRRPGRTVELLAPGLVLGLMIQPPQQVRDLHLLGHRHHPFLVQHGDGIWGHLVLSHAHGVRLQGAAMAVQRLGI